MIANSDKEKKERFKAIVIFKSINGFDGFEFKDSINLIKSTKLKYLEDLDGAFYSLFYKNIFDVLGQTLTNEQAEQVHSAIMYNRFTIFEKIKYNLTNLKNKIMAKQKTKPTKEIEANIELLENNKIENVTTEPPIEYVASENVKEEPTTKTSLQIGNKIVELEHLTIEQLNKLKENKNYNLLVKAIHNTNNCYQLDYISNGSTVKTTYIKLVK